MLPDGNILKRLLSSTLVIFVLAVSCNGQESLGVFTGFVKFPGEAPPRNMFANATDHGEDRLPMALDALRPHPGYGLEVVGCPRTSRCDRPQ